MVRRMQPLRAVSMAMELLSCEPCFPSLSLSLSLSLYIYMYVREKNQNLSVPCTVNFVWAMKRDRYLRLRKQYDFPHLFILEQPWFWRVDPKEPERTWHFFGWDYLNG